MPYINIPIANLLMVDGIIIPITLILVEIEITKEPHNQVNQHQSSSSWQQNPSYQAPLNVPYIPPHNRNLSTPTMSLEDTLKAFMQVTQSSIAKLEGQIG
ncbi:hypothetical protein GIB67_007590, partial [Kingdonia uniflora]